MLKLRVQNIFSFIRFTESAVAVEIRQLLDGVFALQYPPPRLHSTAVVGLSGKVGGLATLILKKNLKKTRNKFFSIKNS